jgi:DNA ligase (NAD+)
LGVEILWDKEISQENFNPEIKGKTFVITGTFTKFSRSELKKIIEKNGGKCSSQVSSKTSVLLAGEKAGSKLQKAQVLNIQVFNEQKICTILEI